MSDKIFWSVIAVGFMAQAIGGLINQENQDP